MTARTETTVPISLESRRHLTEHRDELHALAGSIEITHAELRTDATRGVPIDLDTLRLIRDAADLLTIAARRLETEQESTR